jgi:hypothetical protein
MNEARASAEGERQVWQQLWDDVETLLRRTTNPKK